MVVFPLSKPYFTNDEIEEVKGVLESGWVSQGPAAKKFEESVTQYLNIKEAISVTNCTSALHLSLLASGVKSGSEVLVADYTFPATGHSVLYCGAKPVFIDINPDTYNIDPEKIEEKITDRTKAIIPVHTFGQTADMDPIIKIGKKFNIHVIEDAACALGAKYRNKYAGCIGDIGCYSFHARKGITTGEGGMVVTNDSGLGELVRYLSIFGMTPAWKRELATEFMIPVFHDLGYNYKMSDITAAIGIAQMKKIDRIIEKKRHLARCWNEKLDKIDHITQPDIDTNSFHVYQSYVALTDRTINRNKLIVSLQKKGIQTQIGTYASHIQPVYHSLDECPISRDVYEKAIALPLYYSLTEDDIDLIAKELKTCVGESK
jgi:dTDP-4-amino-4,6-dideoxygalactose transaminase